MMMMIIINSWNVGFFFPIRNAREQTLSQHWTDGLSSAKIKWQQTEEKCNHGNRRGRRGLPTSHFFQDFDLTTRIHSRRVSNI